MSQELWDMVVKDLPSLAGRHAAQAFDFRLQDRHEKHSGVWNKIFKDNEKWSSVATRRGLNPVLIGDDLHRLYHDPEQHDPKQPAYIALLTGDKYGDIRYVKTELLASLQAHYWNKDSEIVLYESNIILSIDEALHDPFFITLTPEKLFTYRHNELCSASLYWKDNEHALQTIGPDDIVGIGDRTSTLQDVSLICGITLTHPKERELRQRHQQC
jgi:hypothetical protein